MFDTHVVDGLRRRLDEAIGDLWDDLVDPAEAYLDASGERWRPLGGYAGHDSAAAGPFR